MYGRTRAEGFGAEVKRRIILGTYVLSSGYYDAYYNRAQKVRQIDRARTSSVAFEKCDALLTPTSPTAAFKIGERTQDPLQMYLADIFTIAVNLAGICGVSIPCGFTSPASCPSASRSSAQSGARKPCSASPTPTNKPRRGIRRSRLCCTHSPNLFKTIGTFSSHIWPY